MKFAWVAAVVLASTVLLGCVTPPPIGDACAAWRQCRLTADRCESILCGPGGQMEKNCDAQYPLCAAPPGPYACHWCGSNCQRVAPGQLCPTTVQPANKDCVEQFGQCAIIDRATPTPNPTATPTPTSTPYPTSTATPTEYPPYP